MSVYGTWLDLDEETPGSRGPIVYRGSHIMPSDDDPRDGTVDIAAIDGDVPRDGQTLPIDEQWPWLRLTVNDETVIIDRAQVAAVHDTLGRWLDRCPEPQTGAAPAFTSRAANADGGDPWLSQSQPQPSAAEQPPGAVSMRPGAVPQEVAR